MRRYRVKRSSSVNRLPDSHWLKCREEDRNAEATRTAIRHDKPRDKEFEFNADNEWSSVPASEY